MGKQRVLYLSCDGVLQPLGFSQVVRPVLGLAARGWSYELVTLEREVDLADTARVEALRRRLDSAGVAWTALPYRIGRQPLSAALNIAHPAAVVARRSRGRSLVHARSYLGALIARAAKRISGVPYLFDTRGFWIDERREQGRWFAHDRIYRSAKTIERALYADAAGAVSLTQLGADDIAGGAFGDWRDKPVVAIPTCVDQDEFTMHRRRRPELADSLVIGWVGSINNWYFIDEGLELFRRVRLREPTAHLLWLTPQVDAAKARIASRGIADSASTVVAVGHDEMPEWLGTIDWGLLLLVETYAKRASMPTKLAEFLASGVRPVHHGCNSEVGSWVEKTGSGFTVPSLDARGLDEAAAKIVERGASRVGLEAARLRSAEHFSLAAGIDRYDTLLSELVARSTE